MGLFVRVWTALSLVRERTGPDDTPRQWRSLTGEPSWVLAENDRRWKGAESPLLRNHFYKGVVGPTFHVGTCSHYNDWLRILWRMIHGSKMAGAPDSPFMGLFDFSDCEGVIGESR